MNAKRLIPILALLFAVSGALAGPGGIPKVMGWASTDGTSGIAWGTTAQVTAANAYVTYDATNLIVNVPTGDGILFRENEVTHVSIAATGAVLLDGTDDVVQLTVQGNATQTALPFVVENSAGTDQFTVSNTGDVVTKGAIDADSTISCLLCGFSATRASVFDGTADEIQVRIQGHSTQTTLPFVIENSAGTDLFTVSNTGITTIIGAGGGTVGLQFTDSNVLIREGFGPNDLDIVADGALVAAFSSTGISVTGGVTTTTAVTIDGTVDEVQLTVQGNATQTTLPFIVENSAGTDQFTVSNTGAVVGGATYQASGTSLTITESTGTAGSTLLLNESVGARLAYGAVTTLTADSSAVTISGSANRPLYFADSNTRLEETGTNVLTFTATGGTLVDGTADVVQLTVQGNATQTTLPFVVENSAGTDQFTVSNAGAVTMLGNLTFTTASSSIVFTTSLILGDGTNTLLTFADDGTDAEIQIPNGSTLDFTDGTNLLFELVDLGTTGRLQMQSGTGLGSSSGTNFAVAGTGSFARMIGFVTDADGDPAIRLEASVDLTTAGRKIVSFGDNSTSSYAEKAYVDLTGLGSFDGGAIIGTGTAIARVNRYTSASIDLPSITNTCTFTSGATATGVAARDACDVHTTAIPTGSIFLCQTSTDLVEIQHCCIGTCDPANQTYTFTTIEY